MRVYHFLNADYGIDDLKHRHLRISRIMELNDPFEFIGINLSDRRLRQGMLEAKKRFADTKGLLCFSKTWRNSVLWGHYTDRNRGLCLGFDVPKSLLEKVNYVKVKLSTPDVIDEAFIRRLLWTKFHYWKYEQEYRAFVSLEEEIDGFYFKDFSPEIRLRAVIVGAQSKVTRGAVAGALDDLDTKVNVFKARAGFEAFEIVRNRNEAMWT